MNVIPIPPALTVVEEWRIPNVGRAADSDLPEWLMLAWLGSRIRMNGYGGFSQETQQGEKLCYAGDTVLLMSDTTIQFRRTDATHQA